MPLITQADINAARAAGYATPAGTDNPSQGDDAITNNAVVANVRFQAAFDRAEQAEANARADLDSRSLTRVQAPTVGPWSVGTNDYATPVGGGISADYLEAKLAAAAKPSTSADFGWTVRTTTGALAKYTSTRSALVTVGDSLTSGYPRPPFATDGSDAWPGIIQATTPTVTVKNGCSVHGQTAAQMALRQGGIVLVTSADVTIPADTSAVALPVGGAQIPTIFTGAFSFDMTLGGTPVTVKQGDAATFTVQRKTAGTAATIPAGTPALTTVGDLSAVHVFAPGRNDFNGGLTADNVEARIRQAVAATVAMINALPQTNPGFLVIGTITGTNEGRGTLGYQAVTEFNRRLAALYPTSWWDWRRYLIDQAIYDAGITPTADDLAKIAADTYPPSLSIDGLHETVKAAAVSGARIKTELQKRGLI